MLGLLIARGARAQAAADSGSFVVRHGADTVAVEQFARTDTQLTGTLHILKTGGVESWLAALAPDSTIPVLEVTVLQPPRTLAQPLDSAQQAGARRIAQRARFIFRGDSVAVDAMRGTGLDTRVFGTERGVVPYINLSFALLEQAVRRGLASGGRVALFNVAGGQTVAATVTQPAADAAQVKVGDVVFDLTIDQAGRILSGRIPAQDVAVERR